MQLKQLHIDRFGVWSDLDLSLSDEEINVFYGPNEAGKTTLMRFVRGILYGFDLTQADQESIRRHPDQKWSGQLTLEHDGQTFSLIRTLDPSHPEGRLTIEAPNPDRIEKWLNQLHEDVDRQTFEQVFAVGLSDIQELSTLNESDAADFLYNLTLDADARNLIQAGDDVRQRADHLWKAGQDENRIDDLMRQRQEILDELDSVEDHGSRFHELEQQRARLDGLIRDMRHRQDTLSQELKGHEFLQRVWQPWNRVEELTRELKSLPASGSIPDDAERQLADIEKEAAAAQKVRDSLEREAEQFKTDASRIAIDERFDRHSCSIRGLVNQRAVVEELDRQFSETEERSDKLRRELDQQLSVLGHEWNADRIARIDTSPSMTMRMMEMARSYRSARWRHRRLNRKWKSLTATMKNKSDQLREALKTHRVTNIADAIEDTGRNLKDLQDLSRLQLSIEYVEKRKAFLEQRKQDQSSPGDLPNWFHAVMTSFLVVGVILIGVGIFNVFAISGVAGAIFVLLGLTWIGIRTGLKGHYERTDAPAADELRRELTECRQEFKRLKSESADLRSRCNRLIPDDDKQSFNDRLHRAISQCLEHRTELDELANMQARLERRRLRLGELKTIRKSAAEDKETARQNWKKLLGQIGLETNLTTKSAFERWQQIVSASTGRFSFNEVKRQQESLHRLHRSLQNRIDDTAQRIGRPQLKGIEPLKVLEMWQHELSETEQRREERDHLFAEERKRRAELAEYQELLDEQQRRSLALFARCGADSREQFEQALLSQMRRSEVRELLEIARLELEEAAQSEPELAIVEEDLQRFDRKHSAATIDTLTQELSDLEDDLRSSHERLGSIRQELEHLANDRRSSELKLHLNQIDAELVHTAEEWCSLQLADQSLDQLREHYERTRQPETLRQASRYLGKLTQGRYETIWSPLGTRILKVTDDHGETFEIEQLSGGTREQLFLAIRLALIQQLAEYGIRLPIVLDDLLVNFDQLRSEGAVETLLEFSGEGHQVLLFTCHLHLAHMFESRGHDPNWLPGHHSRLEERRAG